MQRRTLLILYIILILSPLAAHSQSFGIETFKDIGLPLVEVTTVGGEMPTCDYVSHPDGAMGESITNCTKVPGRMVITLLGDTLYDSREYVEGESGLTIKINGNTSAYKHNKPYKLKLQKKADLLMRGDDRYKDKDWRLIKDAMTLNTMVGLKLNDLLGMQWTPQYEFCNFFINGKYQGCYLLIESVKRNPEARLDVSKTGFIIERDAYWWNEARYFKSTFFSDGRYGWTFKYPDEDDVTDSQVEAIRQCINEAEEAIARGDYEDCIDIRSMACWLLAHDILGTWDTGGSNMYVTRYDNESKLMMGNLWDFDSAFKVSYDNWSRYHLQNDFYFRQLFSSSNPAFTQEYYKAWEEVRDNIGEDIRTYLEDFAVSSTAKALQQSRSYYSRYYYYYCNTVEEDIQQVLDWLAKRLTWMETAREHPLRDFNGMEQTRTSHDSGKAYNLNGQRTNAPKGLYIKNNKLMLAR